MQYLKFLFLNCFLVQIFIKYILPKIRLSTKLPKLNGLQYQVFLNCVKKGDLLLMNDKSKLSHFLIKGEMDHVAVAVDQDQAWQISEMVQKGYQKSTYFDFFKESDRVIILRFRHNSKLEQFISNILSYDKTTYDTKFSLTSKDKLYCSELPAQSASNLDFGMVFKKEILPDDFLSAKNLYTVYDTNWTNVCPITKG